MNIRTLFLLWSLAVMIQDGFAVPVIPGAVGFGITTPAGRGGTIYRVTNLNDTGPGSFRDAIQATVPRIVIFEISGTINLASPLQIYNPYITIAGQTAPSPGITLKGNQFVIHTHDVLVQHIRVRAGDLNGGSPDGIQVDASWGGASAPEVYNIIIDHTSISWAIDENSSTWSGANPEGHRVRDVTWSNNIVSEALNCSTHPKGCHSKGLLIGDGNRNIAVLNNLFAHNVDRLPELKGGATSVVANNIIYNWTKYATHMGYEDKFPGEKTLLSVLGNTYIKGPNMTRSSYSAVRASSRTPAGSQLYLYDNLVSSGITLFQNNASFDPRVSAPPLSVPGFSPMMGIDVEANVLQNAGARPCDRDTVDQRIINEVTTRTGRIINSPSEVGGWPSLPVTTSGLITPSDPNGDAGNGYTNMEEWLHQYSAQVECTDSSDFPPVVSITSPTGNAKVSGPVSIVAAAYDDNGITGVQFRIDDADIGLEDTSAPYAISWDTTSLSGLHSVSAVARDTGGQTSVSGAVSVTVDNVPPTVAITAPTSGTVSGTITVSASASDVGSWVAGVQFKEIHLTSNNVSVTNNIDSEDTTSPYSISWNTSTVTNGGYSLTAVAKDAAGNTAMSSPIAVTVSNSTSTATTLTFTPNADATIKSSSPTTNYGASTILEADNSPVEQFLMRFSITGINGRSVQNAKLRLHNVNSSNAGGKFHQLADVSQCGGWSEVSMTGVTWNTAPAASPAVPALASLGAVTNGSWYEVDITPLITGDGTYCLRVDSTSSDGADYSSREASSFAPQLVVSVATS